jgi:hypothetical protein
MYSERLYTPRPLGAGLPLAQGRGPDRDSVWTPYKIILVDVKVTPAMPAWDLSLQHPGGLELQPSRVSLEAYRGTSLIRNSPPPWHHHRTLGIALLWGDTRGVFLMSEVPQQRCGPTESVLGPTDPHSSPDRDPPPASLSTS